MVECECSGIRPKRAHSIRAQRIGVQEEVPTASVPEGRMPLLSAWALRRSYVNSPHLGNRLQIGRQADSSPGFQNEFPGKVFVAAILEGGRAVRARLGELSLAEPKVVAKGR